MTDSPERSDPEPPDPSRSVLADADVRRYVTARVISVGGSAVTYVALPVLVYSLTGSASWTAAMTVAEALPYLIFGLGAGALADRVDRKKMMVVADLLAAATIATLPLAWWIGDLRPAHVLAAGALAQTAFVFFDAANAGALPTLVRRTVLSRANAVLWGSSTVAETVMPPLAGLALVVVAAAPLLLVNVVTYLLSALMIVAIVRPLSRLRVREPGRTVHGDIAEGVRFLVRHPVVRVFVLISTLASVAGGAFMAMYLVWADLTLDVREGDWRLSVLYLAWGLGSVIGSAVSARISARLGPARVPLVLLPVITVLGALTVLAPTWWLGALGLLGWGSGYMVVTLNAITVRQVVTPEALMSRVMTTGRLISWGMGYTGGAALAGALASTLGHQGAMMVGMGACLLAAGLAWASPLRAMGSDAVEPADDLAD